MNNQLLNISNPYYSAILAFFVLSLVGTSLGCGDGDDDTCSVGSESCDCTEGGGCDEDLTCYSGKCVKVDDHGGTRDNHDDGNNDDGSMSANSDGGDDDDGSMGDNGDSGTDGVRFTIIEKDFADGAAIQFFAKPDKDIEITEFEVFKPSGDLYLGASRDESYSSDDEIPLQPEFIGLEILEGEWSFHIVGTIEDEPNTPFDITVTYTVSIPEPDPEPDPGPSECPAACKPTGSSICCRPPFCSGDCLGSPCC